MKTTERLKAIGALALAAASIGAAQERAVSFEEYHGDWRVVGDPELGSCLATLPKSFNQAEMHIVAKAAEKEYRFALTSKAWRSLKDGALTLQAAFIDAEEDISDIWSLSTEGTSEASGGPRINWTILRAKNDGANFVDQMRTGYALWFFVDEVPIAKFGLDRSAAALDALDRCRSSIRIDEDFDPFAR